MVHELWGAHLDTVANESEYYLSAVELMAIAVSLQANLRIFEQTPMEALQEIHRNPRNFAGPCAFIRI
eukprot:3576934-Pyramimonas_sp.AAC.1